MAKRILAVGRITAPEPDPFASVSIREVKVVADVGREKLPYSKIRVASGPAIPPDARRAEMAEARELVFRSVAKHAQEGR